VGSVSQWAAEIAEKAPSLNVYIYPGVQNLPPDFDDGIIDQCDVVLATYSTLSKELHFAQPPPDRSMRYSKVHQSRRSPLVGCSFWRVCLDEAQMIEGSVTSAATVACLIPRIVLIQFRELFNIRCRMRGVSLVRPVNEMLPIYMDCLFS